MEPVVASPVSACGSELSLASTAHDDHDAADFPEGADRGTSHVGKCGHEPPHPSIARHHPRSRARGRRNASGGASRRLHHHRRGGCHHFPSQQGGESQARPACVAARRRVRHHGESCQRYLEPAHVDTGNETALDVRRSHAICEQEAPRFRATSPSLPRPQASHQGAL